MFNGRGLTCMILLACGSSWIPGCTSPPPDGLAMALDGEQSSKLGGATVESGGSRKTIGGTIRFPAATRPPSFVSVDVDSVTAGDKPIKRIATLEIGINPKRGANQVRFETSVDIPPAPSAATIYYKATVRARDAGDKIMPDCPAIISYFKVLGRP